MLRRNTGQSIVEYAILLGVVIAALLIMQMFIKRSYQGGLKESADKIGEQFSAGGTTIKQKRTMSSDQNIVEGVATDTTINSFKPSALDENAQDALGSDVYSYSQRTGGKSTMTTQSKTDSAAAEKTRASDFNTTEVTDFTSPVTE
ncbi:MAG: hypothetical protein WC561_06335 [Candidatus Omnitrophota bacterium]